MQTLTLQLSNLIVDKSLEKGRELGFARLAVVVLDAGGQIKVIKREDGGLAYYEPRLQWGRPGESWEWVSEDGNLPGEPRKLRCFSVPSPIFRVAGWCPFPEEFWSVLNPEKSWVLWESAVILLKMMKSALSGGIKAAGLKPDTGDPE